MASWASLLLLPRDISKRREVQTSSLGTKTDAPGEKRKGRSSVAWSLRPAVGGAQLSHLVEWSFIGLRMWGSLPPFLILAYPQNMGTRSVCPQQPAVWCRPPGWRGAIAQQAGSCPRSSQGPRGAGWEAAAARRRCARPPTPPESLCSAQSPPQVPRGLQRWVNPAIGGSIAGARGLGNVPGEISHSSSVGGYMHVFV